MNQDARLEAAAQARADLEQEAAALAAYTRAAGDFLTETLRADLRRLAGRARKLDGDAVAEALLRWAAATRIDNLADWLDAKGWAALEADPERAAKVEAALLVAAEGMLPVAYVENLFDLTGGRKPEEDADADALARMVQTPMKRAYAVLTLPRNAPRPADLPQDAPLALGLDGLKALLARHDWIPLEHALPEHPTLTAKPGGAWLRLLAAPWLADIAKAEKERAGAVPFAVQRRNVIRAESTGADFLRFPTALEDAAAWCSALVPVDGNTIFAEEPFLPDTAARIVDPSGAAVTLYKPRAWTIAPERVLQHNAQMYLPGMVTEPDRNPDLAAFLAVSATDAACLPSLPGVCAKLAPLLPGIVPLDGKTTVAGPIEDLVKLLYPDWKKRRKMTGPNGDIARVAGAVAAYRALRLYEARPGRPIRDHGQFLQGFMDLSASVRDKPEVGFRMNPALRGMMTTERGKASFFLVNLSRVLDLDAGDPRTIAVAMRIYAYWHTCKQRGIWMPDRLDFLDADALLVTANAVSERVAEVLAGTDHGKAGQKARQKARAELLDRILPRLVEAEIVGRIDDRRPVAGSRGNSWLVKLLPPPDFLEASRRAIAGRREHKPRRK